MEQKIEISLSEGIVKELIEMKETSQGYDELLKEIIKGYNRHLLAEKARQAKQGKGVWIKL